MKNTILKIVVAVFITISITGVVNAAQLKGKVSGIGADKTVQILPNATIQWIGTKTGTYSDKQGNFSIEKVVNSNHLVVSFAGYKKDTITVKPDQNFLEIELKADLQTEEIEVNAKQPDVLLGKATIKSETITIRGLQKAACCNLSESFQTNPSVDVSYTDAVTGAKQIQLLGLQGIYTQMMTEQMPNLRGLASFYGLSFIPGSWMESIQIAKGTGSVLSSPESITGQINVEFKKPETSDPLLINLYGDNYGRMEGNFNTRIHLSKNLSTAILGHASTYQTKKDLNNDGFIDKPLTTQYNIFNRWLYEVDNIEARFGFKALDEDRKGGQTKYFDTPSDTLYSSHITTRRYEAFGKLGFIFANHSSLGIMFNSSYHKQNSNFGNNIYNADQTSLFFNTIYNGELAEEILKYNIGAGVSIDNLNEVFNGTNYLTRESMPGAFMELTYSGIKDLNIIAGIRSDFHNIYGTWITPRLHLRYKIGEEHSIRVSAGKGYRSPHIFAENINVLASSRHIIFDEKLKYESAWNYGINTSHELSVFGFPVTMNLEFYRTDFQNQIIPDIDKNPQEIHFYNLKGSSYSNSFQIDANFEPINGLIVTLAYRFNDVKMTISDSLMQKPLVSRDKAFLNLAYSTKDDDWKFDFTVDLNGGGRLPNTSSNPKGYQFKSTYPAFFQMQGQITKSFKDWDIYIGGENLGNYMQHHAIIAYDKPFSKYFDSSMIWGPLMGRTIYAGIRFKLFN